MTSRAWMAGSYPLSAESMRNPMPTSRDSGTPYPLMYSYPSQYSENGSPSAADLRRYSAA